jgi:arylsulfatase A-like enzyme/Flp pilus assembly protein TadD
MSRAATLPALAMAIGLLAQGCPRSGSSEPPAGIVLITLDTTRADHIGCYGSAVAKTPSLDALAGESVRFDQAMSAVPTTLASHSTMFTGQYPPVHGVRYNGMFKLGDASVTVAERLRHAGFTTAAITSSFPVNAKTGINQGFATYRDLFSEPGGEKLDPTAERSAADVTKAGLELIRGAGDKPFFVWLHYFDAHYPYKPPFPYSSSFHDHPYDGEIAYVDAQLGALFSALKSDGLWDRLAIVVAGDHGEGLYDHGERMHSHLAYQTTLHVPLFVKATHVKRGSVVTEPVTLADIGPTLLDLAGQPVPAGLDGISLKPFLGGTAPPRRALYFETLAGSLNFGWSPIEGIRRGKWKLIRSSDPELYDLDADPAEARNVFQTETDVAGDLGATADHEIARWASETAPAQTTPVPLDPADVSRLASLGYLGGTVSPTHRGGPSPRSMAHLESELLLLQDMMLQRLWNDAMRSAVNVLHDDPTNRFALNAAADASAGLRDFPSAKRYGRELLDRYPEFTPGWLAQGRIEVAQKNYPAAEAFFRKGLEHVPDEPSLVYSLALCLLAEHRAHDARPLIEKAVAVPGTDPSFRVLLALNLAMEGDADGATKALAQAIAAGYKNVTTLKEEPLLAPLRKTPGFAETIAAVKR